MVFSNRSQIMQSHAAHQVAQRHHYYQPRRRSAIFGPPVVPLGPAAFGTVAVIEVPLDHPAPDSARHPHPSGATVATIRRVPAATTAKVDAGSAVEVILVVVLVLVIAGRVYLWLMNDAGKVAAAVQPR